MSIFAKTKVVLWPKTKTSEFYFDRKENNYFSFDLSLWQPKDETSISALRQFVAENHISELTLLLSDDVVATKSFVYDTKITSIDKSEVIMLAQGFVNYPIGHDAIEYTLTDKGDKTIIQCQIFDKEKIDILYSNLANLGVKLTSQLPVSAAISNVVSTFYPHQYFVLYPLEDNECLLALSRNTSVFLTTLLKGSSFDIQKIINYSNLYFDDPTTKLFTPLNGNYEINSTTKLDKTSFDDHQIASNLTKPANLPLPVIGAMISQTSISAPPKLETVAASEAGSPAPKADIINVVTPIKTTRPMEDNKRNILPIIAVFVLTAGIASVIFWYVVNRNQAENIQTPVSDASQTETTPTIAETPTPMATATPANVSKNIKIQVLNATEINGQAATLKAKLTALGFKSIAVGNSPDTLTSNEVHTKADNAQYAAYFQSALGDFFPATPTEDLKDTSAYDVVFYIGTDLSKAPAPPAATSVTDEVTPTSALKKTSGSPTPTVKTTATPTKKLSPTPTE